ncbi:cysteine methyltransferase [Halobiforma lacisalsi AJ5]|uniref:methylated-DNA--[protein]-cysteine S-methyltransferase n=1 Tax=Natronobacterium lacisalsi AJ5 TaxID=358396 RepID=M0LL65_NATLA|nr:methylated-DNA--[protein]-cysteine S-methyltransferase [Halobiforma lacisalsi]APW97310.1 cysteine methyltransferase [Halobiforma lacisalsi AJ5]EMA33823.1 methylated-DNA--protein-cysteine methyltransferase [Halobiforma lacisalsi AJ5]
MNVRVFGADREIDGSLIRDDAETVRTQLREYEAGEQTAFDLEIDYPATFTGDVMRVIADVPYGETRPYGDLAAALETAPIAVGQACGRNPIPIVVPCHRVVGADSLGGYGGGLDLKRRLLEHEGAAIVSDET